MWGSRWWPDIESWSPGDVCHSGAWEDGVEGIVGGKF